MMCADGLAKALSSYSEIGFQEQEITSQKKNYIYNTIKGITKSWKSYSKSLIIICLSPLGAGLYIHGKESSDSRFRECAEGYQTQVLSLFCSPVN